MNWKKIFRRTTTIHVENPNNAVAYNNRRINYNAEKVNADFSKAKELGYSN